MKVSVTMQEIQYFEFTQEVEMTVKEFNIFNKTGKLPEKKEFDVQQEFDFTGKINDFGHVITEQNITDINKL